MNSISISGKIAKMDEMKTTANGKKYLNFDLAHNHTKDKTSFFHVTAWQHCADMVANKFIKGHWIGLTGVLCNDVIGKRKDQNGKEVNMYKLYINVDKIDTSYILFNKKNQGGNENSGGSPDGYEPKPPFDPPF